MSGPLLFLAYISDLPESLRTIDCSLMTASFNAYMYRNFPKFSDRQVWANSADLDQTAPRGESDQGLHCLPFRLHRLDSLRYGRAT